jgi:hypothetical protein
MPHATESHPPALGWSQIEVPPSHSYTSSAPHRLPSLIQCQNQLDENSPHWLTAPPPPLHCLLEPIKGTPRTAAPQLTTCRPLLHLFMPQVAPHRSPPPPLAPLHSRPISAPLLPVCVAGKDHQSALLLLPHPQLAPRLCSTDKPRSDEPL